MLFRSASPDHAPSGSDAAKVRVVTFKGDGAVIRRASGHLDRLDRTSKPFKAAVSARLDAYWKDLGATEKCATAPVIIVKRWRSDGWARISDEGTFAPCPSGGNWAIWQRKASGWKEVLGGQDVPSCSSLRRRDVPADIWDTCYNGQGDIVTYTGP